MKNFLLICLLVSFAEITIAQTADSVAYQLQRKKVNDLLGKRSIRFNQYFESLNQHTGIFGLQTKKDVRRSNELLMDIVATDNAVFKELKTLLDYRTTVQTQAQDQSKEANGRNVSFMATINKLRSQNQQLQAEARDQENSADRLKTWLVVSVISALILLFAIIRLKSTKLR